MFSFETRPIRTAQIRGRKPHREWFWLSLVVAFVAALGLGLCIDKRAQAWPEGAWTVTGSMSTPRLYHEATLLPNGKVLVTGGQAEGWGEALESAELYDPTTGKWTLTSPMHIRRYGHSAVLLPNGKVLVVGGVNWSGVVGTSELYNPSTKTWTMTGSVKQPRACFVATLIAAGPLAGKVLIAGGNASGCGYDDYVASSELYDPGSGKWSYTNGALQLARELKWNIHQLGDGSLFIVGGVIIVGGYTWVNNSEIFNQATQTWSLNNRKVTAAQGRSALMADGRVLVTGGVRNQPTTRDVADAEIFDPKTGKWSRTASMSAARNGHTLTPLTNGQLLVAGGNSGGWEICKPLSSAQRYVPSSGKWLPAASMHTARLDHTDTRLRNGQVLVTGGITWDEYCQLTALKSSELYSYPQPAATP